jgi:DNA-binding GntR family transcriptional regulator
MIDSDIATARELLDTYSHEIDALSWSRLNARFHQALYEPCGNAVLLQMIDDIQSRPGPSLRRLVSETSGLKRPQEEHRAILEASAAGDVVRAVELLRAHIETTKKETAARLRRRGAA